MRGLLAGGLGVSLGLCLAHARADDPVRSVPAGPVVTLGKPIADLGRPVPLDQNAANISVVDPQIQRAAFTPPLLAVPSDAIKANGSEVPLPMPRGPIPNPAPLLAAQPQTAEKIQAPKSAAPTTQSEPRLSPLPAPTPVTQSGPILASPYHARPYFSGPSTVGPIAPAPLLSAPFSPMPYGPSPYAPGSRTVEHPIGPIQEGPVGPMAGPVVVSEGDAGCHDGTVCCNEGACGFSLFGLRPWCGSLIGCTDFGSPPSQFYFSGEYLLWYTKQDEIPPLLTTGPNFGVLGTPGVSVLFPTDTWEERSGARFVLGWWFNPEQTCGIEGNFLFLPTRESTFVAASSGVPNLSRPFINALTGMEASELIANGGLSGAFMAERSSTIWGAEANFRKNWCQGCCWRLDSLLGFRYFHLAEELNLREDLVVETGGLSPVGTTFALQDGFRTRNDFYGGQTGLELEVRRGRWSLELLGKIGLGAVQQRADIAGSTMVVLPPSAGGLVYTEAGGLLAQKTNIGSYRRNQFAILPEAGIKVGFQLTQHVRATVGYSFLYLSDAVRPGQQIDRVVNVSQIPIVTNVGVIPGVVTPPFRPAPVFGGTDFWAQGINFGLEIRF